MTTAAGTRATSSAGAGGVDPFLSSLASRRSHLERTRTLLSAASASSSAAHVHHAGAPPSSRRCQTLSLTPTERIVLHPLTPLEISTLEGPDCRCRCDGNGSRSENGTPNGKGDWSKVLAMRRTRGEAEGGCDASDWLRKNVRDTTFAGWVVLGVPPCCSSTGAARDAAEDGADDEATEEESNGGAMREKFGPPGVRSNLLVKDSILEYGCAVSGNGTVSNVHVGGGAALVNCGSVSFPSNGEKFTDGMEITVGAESGGGRDVNVTAESTLIEVCAALGMGRSGGKKAAEDEVMTIPMNILCPSSYVSHTPNVTGVYLSPHSSIDGATSITRAVLLPHSSLSHSVTATNVLLQWNASITSNSSVDNTLVMEHSHIGPNSVIAHTILGPDVHVSCGEIHASVLGPNTNAHHQSLLIGVLWPLGRGNVGYGANVGSNHTSRLPDQECASGEGTFWGLTCCIKIPLDVASAPYSVIAAGSSMAPGQRLTMPFSLIVDGANGSTNILPGWVLYASPYTVTRSEAKFANRRKAQRHGHYTGWRIVRPAVIDMCMEARRSLLLAAGSTSSGQSTEEGAPASGKKVYKTDRDVPGIGFSHLSERSRLGGIKAYADLIQLYALRGLFDRARKAWEECGGVSAEFTVALSALLGDVSLWRNNDNSPASPSGKRKAVEWPPLPWEEPSFTSPDALWDHQLSVLRAESPSILGSFISPASSTKLAVLLLRKTSQLESEYAVRVRKSKSRDDTRGAATVPGYADSHTKADDDAVVKDVMRAAGETERTVNDMIRALGGTSGEGVHTVASRL